MTDLAERARRFVLDSHTETVETVLKCADSVASGWNEDATEDSAGVADALRAELEAEEVWAQLPELLAGAVRATGHSLSATPVAAPPYVVATSRGPMCRATLDGGRLVLSMQVFDIEREETTRYVRRATTPAETLRANFK